MKIAKYLLSSKQIALDTERSGVISCRDEGNDGLQIVDHNPVFISDYNSPASVFEGIPMNPDDSSFSTKVITNIQLPCIPQPKIFSNVLTPPDVCPDLTSGYSSSDLSMSLTASQSNENLDNESNALTSSFTHVASCSNSSDDSTSKQKSADCYTPIKSKKSKTEEKQAVRTSPKRRKQLPLGPRHLEYDYHIAYRDFKETAYLELGKIGYRGPFKKSQIKTDPWSITAEKLLLLKQRPAYKKAAKNLNKADKFLNIALMKGESWERTSVPAEFTWENEELQDYISIRGNIPTFKDIGEARKVPFVHEIPNTRSRKPSAKVIEMMEASSSDQVTDNSPFGSKKTIVSPSINSVSPSGKPRTQSRRKKPTVAVENLVVETSLQSKPVDDFQLAIAAIKQSSNTVEIVTKRKAKASVELPDEPAEKDIAATLEDSPSSNRVNKRRKKEPKSDTSTVMESEVTVDAPAPPKVKRRTSERLKRQ